MSDDEERKDDIVIGERKFLDSLMAACDPALPATPHDPLTEMLLDEVKQLNKRQKMERLEQIFYWWLYEQGLTTKKAMPHIFEDEQAQYLFEDLGIDTERLNPKYKKNRLLAEKIAKRHYERVLHFAQGIAVHARAGDFLETEKAMGVFRVKLEQVREGELDVNEFPWQAWIALMKRRAALTGYDAPKDTIVIQNTNVTFTSDDMQQAAVELEEWVNAHQAQIVSQNPGSKVAVPDLDFSGTEKIRARHESSKAASLNKEN